MVYRLQSFGSLTLYTKATLCTTRLLATEAKKPYAQACDMNVCSPPYIIEIFLQLFG